MASRFESLIPDEANPYITDAMQRRSLPPAPQVEGPPVITDTSSGLSRRVRSAGENFASYLPALQGLGNQLIGDQDAAQKRYAEYQQGQERAQAIGPDVQTLEDVKRRGGTPGAYAEYAATQAVNFAPDILATVASGGIGGAVTSLARRGGVRLAEEGVKRAAIRGLAEEAAAGSATARAGLEAATAARTPRKEVLDAAAGLADAKAKQAAAQRAGQIAGATVGQYPGVVADSVQELQKADQAGAAKIAGTDVISAAFGSIPAERFLSRIGGGAAREAIAASAEKILPRITKEFVKQGAIEGSVGVGQAAIQLAGHKWVNDNVDLLGPQAFDRYLAEMVGGFLAGGTLSGAHTAGVAGAERWREGAQGRGEAFTALKERLATNLRTAADAARSRVAAGAESVRNRTRPGEPVGEPTDAGSVFRDAYSKVKGFADEGFAKARSVADRFRNNEGTLNADEDVDAESTRLARETAASLIHAFESGESDAPLANFVGTRAANTNPIKLDNGLQNILATVFPKNDDIWQQPAAARSIMRSVEKIFTGDKRTKRDERNIARMQSWFPEHVAKWEAIGPEYARATQLAQQATREQGKTADNAPSDIQQEELSTDPYQDTSEGDAATAGVRATDPFEKLTTLRPDDPSYEATRAAARAQVLGENPNSTNPGGDATAVIKENGKNPKFFSDRLKQADTVLMADTFRLGNQELRKAVDLGSLIVNQRGRDPGIDPRTALLKGLGELRTAGVKTLARSFTPGEIKLKDGSGTLRILAPGEARKSPNDVYLRELQSTVGNRPAPVTESAPAAPVKVPPLPRDVREKANAKEKLRPDKGEFSDPAQLAKTKYEQGPREAPPVTRVLPRAEERNNAVANDSPVVRELLARRDRAERALTNAESIARKEGREDAFTRTRRYKAMLKKAVDANAAYKRAAKRAALEKPLDTGRRSSEQVSTTGVVGDVEIRQPHEKTVVSALKSQQRARERINKLEAQKKALEARQSALEDGATPQKGDSEIDVSLRKVEADIERTTEVFDTAAVEAGRAIGLAELQKLQDNGQITNRDYGKQRRALMDPRNTDVALKYFDDAQAGKFDPAPRVIETAQDKGDVGLKGRDQLSVAKVEARIVNAWGGKNAFKAADRLTEVLSRPAPALKAFMAKPFSKDAFKELPPKQQAEYKLLREALRSFDELPPSNPIRKAVEKASPEWQQRFKSDEPAFIGPDKPLEGKASLVADEDIDVGLKSATGDGKHDLGKEEGMLNAMLDRLGVAEKITLHDISEANHPRTPGGLYKGSKLQIFISPTLHGAERVEVLMHELGHHIVRSEIAKASGGKLTVKDLGYYEPAKIIDALKEHNPELHKALRADFRKWKAQNPRSSRYVDVRASRAPLHRAESIRAAGAEDYSTVGGRSQESREYVYSMDEWMADNISRALTGGHEGQSVISKFFKSLAEQLRKVYEILFKTKQHDKYAPAPSVEKWVKSLFDANVSDVREATGMTTTAKGAEAAITVAAATAVPPPPSGPTDVVPSGPSPSGKPPSNDPRTVAAMARFVRDVMRPQERKILDRVLSRGPIVKQLREIYSDNPRYRRALDSATHGLENRIALAYIAWKQGKLTTGPEGRSALINTDDDFKAIMRVAGEGDLAQRIFDDVATGYISRVESAGKVYDVRALAERNLGTLNRTLNHFADFKEKIGEPLSRFWDSKLSRAWSTGVPAARKLASLIQRPQGTTGDDLGFTPSVVHTTAKYLRNASRAFEGLNDRELHRALTYLQRGTNSTTPQGGGKNVQAAIDKVHALMRDAHAYAKEAGVDIGYREGYFPVLLDLRNEKARNDLTALYMQPKFEVRIRELLGSKENPATGKIEDLVKNLVDGVANGPEGIMASTGEGAPNFKGANYRLSQFIYDLGSEADIKKFASLQSKNPAEILGRYIEPLVKRAEYARRFGDDGARAQQLLDAMAKQGATPAQVEEARNTLKAALGTYGAEGSPTLAALSPALARKFSGPRSRAFIQGAQAYQNARLLPLATLSSLVDPLGIAVRTGGDFKTAWDGFKVGLRALRDKGTRDDIHALLETLGSTEDIGTLEALNQGFGGAGSPTSRRVNEFVFKANGLQSWTRATRYMALEAANGFLLKHAEGLNDTSVRYLDELGLKKGDVRLVFEAKLDGSAKPRVSLLSDAERAKAKPHELARDDRVRKAMMQFVDEAILRPSSQQTPLWYSDPYVGLVTQYKTFAYAMFDQIGGRIARETKHGNPSVLLPALAYLPVTMMAEILREFLQYGPDGNPRRRSWGPEEYAALAVSKNLAIKGPRYDVQSDVAQDIQRHRVPGSSQLGPTASQVRDVIGGNPATSFEAALPASALWKRWNDNDRVERDRKVG